MKKIVNGYEIEVKSHILSVDKTMFVNYHDNFHLITDKELSEFLSKNGYN